VKKWACIFRDRRSGSKNNNDLPGSTTQQNLAIALSLNALDPRTSTLSLSASQSLSLSASWSSTPKVFCRSAKSKVRTTESVLAALEKVQLTGDATGSVAELNKLKSEAQIIYWDSFLK